MTARDRTVLIVVLAVVAIAAGWLLVVQPKRAEASKLGGSVQAVQSQLAGVEGQIAADQQARGTFSTDYAELAQLGEAVPQDDNVPSLIYQIQSAARDSGVDFRGLQVTPAGSSASSSSSSSSSSLGSASGRAAPAATVPPGVSMGSGGFAAEQFTFSFSGSFFDLSNFLGRLDSFVVTGTGLVRVSGRLMTLNAISLGPSPQGFPEMNANVSATTYLLPASQGLLDGASAAGPAPAPVAGTATSLPPASGAAPPVAAGSTAPATGGAGPTAPAAAISAPASAISGGQR